MSDLLVRSISADETIDIRHQVMWPDQPREFVLLAEDYSDIAHHYGLFLRNQHIGVVSKFIYGQQAQFRKLAILEAMQGNGYGSALLEHVILEAKRMNIKRLWCNARADALPFYQRFGLKPTGRTFTKGGLDFEILEAFI